jgi:hydroxyethylthiazole kinase-like uncharacterized protein yjeF
MCSPKGMKDEAYSIRRRRESRVHSDVASRIPPDHDPDPNAAADKPEQEVYILSREAVRQVDALAQSQYGIPSILLMENAAFHIADIAIHLLTDIDKPTALIVCGPGNNGGDGFAAARHLHNAGVAVHIVAVAPDEQYQGDAAANLRIVRNMGLPLTTLSDRPAIEQLTNALEALGKDGADLLIDALLGTGAHADQPLRPPLPELIGTINKVAEDLAITVLAVDVPSGLDADTGEPVPPLAAAVQADVTVTFVGLKTGFTKLGAQNAIGDLVVADIGVPRELTARLGTLLSPSKPEEPQPPLHGPSRRRRGDTPD